MAKHALPPRRPQGRFHPPHDPRSPPIERSLFQFIWKYSKRDQLILLLVTACLFPLLYLTLELPKRIINDAIGAQTSIIDVWGYEVEQLNYLWILCGAFLASVLVHGLTKMRINTMKGVLAERMLRRFRYSLIARVLRFPQPYFERCAASRADGDDPLFPLCAKLLVRSGGCRPDPLASLADPHAAAADQQAEQKAGDRGAQLGLRDR